MKKILLSILAFIALSVSTPAQAAATALEGQSITLAYDHTAIYATKIYTNGVLFRAFTAAEVTAISATTFKVTCPPLPKGSFNVTATVTDAGVESDPSPVLVLTVKPSSPGNLRKL